MTDNYCSIFNTLPGFLFSKTKQTTLKQNKQKNSICFLTRNQFFICYHNYYLKEESSIIQFLRLQL